MPKQDDATLERCVQEPEFAASHWEWLIECVAGSEESAVEQATEALENCGSVGLDALSKLGAKLCSAPLATLGTQRLYWLSTLIGRFGADARGLQSEMTQLVMDPSIELPARERAAWCLGEIGPLEPTLVAQIRTLKIDGTERLKRLIDRALEACAVAP